MRLLTAAFAVALVASAACAHRPSAHEQLNGTWVGSLMTVTIDFDKGTYVGANLGQSFSQDLKLVSEQANVVIFETNGHRIMAQLQPGGDAVIITKQPTPEMPEGGFPLLLKRRNSG